MSDLIIENNTHGNNNRRHDCSYCQEIIKIHSAEIVVKFKPTVNTYRYHVDCWNKVSRPK